MLRLDFKNRFRKRNVKIYNFLVEAEFKFALEEGEKRPIDLPIDPVEGPPTRWTRQRVEHGKLARPPSRWRIHRLDGGCSVARWDFHRAGAKGVASHRAGLQGHRLGGPSTEPVEQRGMTGFVSLFAF